MPPSTIFKLGPDVASDRRSRAEGRARSLRRSERHDIRRGYRRRLATRPGRGARDRARMHPCRINRVQRARMSIRPARRKPRRSVCNASRTTARMSGANCRPTSSRASSYSRAASRAECSSTEGLSASAIANAARSSPAARPPANPGCHSSAAGTGGEDPKRRPSSGPSRPDPAQDRAAAHRGIAVPAPGRSGHRARPGRWSSASFRSWMRASIPLRSWCSRSPIAPPANSPSASARLRRTRRRRSGSARFTPSASILVRRYYEQLDLPPDPRSVRSQRRHRRAGRNPADSAAGALPQSLGPRPGPEGDARAPSRGRRTSWSTLNGYLRARQEDARCGDQTRRQQKGRRKMSRGRGHLRALREAPRPTTRPSILATSSCARPLLLEGNPGAASRRATCATATCWSMSIRTSTARACGW